MILVLDASLALSWYFEDERTPAADALLDQVANAGAVVPARAGGCRGGSVGCG